MRLGSSACLVVLAALSAAPAFAQIDMSQDPPVLVRRPDAPVTNPSVGPDANPNTGTYPPPNATYTPTPMTANPYQIPEGSTVIVRLDDTLDTSRVGPGKKFTAKLAEDLVTANGQRIPRGKKVHGHVSDVSGGFRGRMLLTFNEIETNHGWVPLMATVVGIPGEKGVHAQGDEGEIERNGMNKQRTIESAVAGAAIGAVAGSIGGGGRGAGIGAGAGAALGTTAGILTDRNLRLIKGTQIELRLDRPLTVPQS